jgi:hypothetical protein
MGWPDLIAYVVASAGAAACLRQVLAFVKFALKRRSLNAVIKATKGNRSPEDWLRAAHALQAIDSSPPDQDSDARPDQSGSEATAQPSVVPPANLDRLRPALVDQPAPDALESG